MKRSHILEPASKWIWYSQISRRQARSMDCNWLKHSMVNIPTFQLFSHQEMPTQSAPEYEGCLFPSLTTSRKQSHSYPRSWLKSLPVNHHERSLHLDRRKGLARQNPARRVSSRVWLPSAGGV